MHNTSSAGLIGLIAGSGELPVEAARNLSNEGFVVRAISLKGLTAPSLAGEVDEIRSVPLGRLGETRAAMQSLGVDSVLLVGKVPRALLDGSDGLFQPDEEALAWLKGGGQALSDEGILGLVAGWLAEQEVEILRQDKALSSMVAPVGPLAQRSPTERELDDLAQAREALLALGRGGSGQCVVMSAGKVLTQEEELGTDDAIRRAGAVADGPLTVVKGARLGQDLRFDLPAIGPETIRVMQGAGASALAVEAGRTILVRREEMLKVADAAEIAIWSFPRREAVS